MEGCLCNIQVRVPRDIFLRAPHHCIPPACDVRREVFVVRLRGVIYACVVIVKALVLTAEPRGFYVRGPGTPRRCTDMAFEVTRTHAQQIVCFASCFLLCRRPPARPPAPPLCRAERVHWANSALIQTKRMRFSEFTDYGVSTKVMDLIRAMLVVDCARRPYSADNLTHHPFFAG